MEGLLELAPAERPAGDEGAWGTVVVGFGVATGVFCGTVGIGTVTGKVGSVIVGVGGISRPGASAEKKPSAPAAAKTTTSMRPRAPI